MCFIFKIYMVKGYLLFVCNLVFIENFFLVILLGYILKYFYVDLRRVYFFCFVVCMGFFYMKQCDIGDGSILVIFFQEDRVVLGYWIGGKLKREDSDGE